MVERYSKDWIDQERKIRMLIEIEKLRDINLQLLWEYLNFHLLKVESFEDDEFVRADEFHKYLDMIKQSNELFKDSILEGCD